MITLEEEVGATLNNLDDEIDDTEHALTSWSGSYSPGSARRTFSSATGTFTYGTGSYTGSPSFVSLPTFSPRSPLQQPLDPRVRLSRITERTEESRPSSGTFTASNIIRAANATPDGLRRSAILGIAPSHSRSSTDPSSDRTLPPPGRLSELRAVFESQSPSGSHSRATSSPGFIWAGVNHDVSDKYDRRNEVVNKTWTDMAVSKIAVFFRPN